MDELNRPDSGLGLFFNLNKINRFSSMAHTIRLGIIVGIMVTLLLVGIVYFFRPATPVPLETAQSIVNKTPVNSSLKNNAEHLKPKQAIPIQSSNQLGLIQQRDRLYQDFEEISHSLSVGQQPDFRQVSDLLEKQKQLVKLGGLSANDAISYCQFLRQILPAMDQQINQHILQLEQLEHATS
ncbi:hypothetical protein HLH17_05120 [Acinetobacter sp. ANC 5380]|uniref:Uncharacterized protein n=1 Tax=Acinetobacter terrae TaxID=2731247 RepID=A0A7Y2RE71_9GAMM|nr:hypothetical protein [Acinetobacter terrae]NNH77067.1 hypothetical protein [Acinetobacter terrae]